MPLDALETDESRWPIVIHRTIGIPDDDQVDAFVARATQHALTGETYAIIFDNTHGGRATTYMRNESKRWLKAHNHLLRKSCAGTAFVFTNPALRFVMSTVLLVVEFGFEHKVCATVDEAVAWCERQLHKDALMRAG